MNGKNFTSPNQLSAEAQLSDAIREQARRHMPGSMRSLHSTFCREERAQIRRAKALESALNSQISKQSEARKQFVESGI